MNEAYQSALVEGGGWFVDNNSFQFTIFALTTSHKGFCSSTPVEMRSVCSSRGVMDLRR